ncbi:MAG: hypothetical protein HFJ27_00150 [Clostridia bacterium]|nr:hypothetical protein [Clostridia bacterium]
MKKKFVIIVIIILLLLITGYFYIRNKKSNIPQIPHCVTQLQLISGEVDMEEYKKALKEQSIDNVSLKIKKDTITKASATFILTDKNKVFCKYSNEYVIEVKKNGNWQIQVPINPISWDLLVTTLGTEVSEISIAWDKFYGELERGKYRLGIKCYTNKEEIVYAEFEIK